MPVDTLTLTADRVLRPDGSLRPGAVSVAGGQIIALAEEAPADAVYLPGILAPGFVDLQLNGGIGIDLGATDVNSFQRVLARQPAAGVTSVLATFVSCPIERLFAAFDVARQVTSRPADVGARLVGVHVEGPFLAPAWRGAHEPSFLRAPDRRLIADLVEGCGDLFAIMTLAPELPAADECISALVDAGVVAAIGHSGADAATAEHAADLGARLVTHLFNAQIGLHHRRPGIVGQALTDPRLTVSIIADLEHVAPVAVRLAFRCKPGGVALITDAVAAAGLAPGRHTMPDGEVVVVEGEPPRRPDGTLAGSGLSLDQAVRNAVAVGVPVADALLAASTVPATVLGRTDIGQIAPGAHADLVWLDADLRPIQVWIAGTLILPNGRLPY